LPAIRLPKTPPPAIPSSALPEEPTHSRGCAEKTPVLGLCHFRVHTTATLCELAASFGLNDPDSVSNLIRRAEKHLAQSRQDRHLAARIVETITKNQEQDLTPSMTPSNKKPQEKKQIRRTRNWNEQAKTPSIDSIARTGSSPSLHNK
jgi:hypothetical protein